MEFSDKFKTLLSLTATKSVSLANYVNIDSAQISRMKTGARKMPRDTKLIKDISEYLAARFDNEYRLSALYKLTGDVRLQSSLDKSVLTAVIYNWLVDAADSPYAQTGSFLKQINEFEELENSPDDKKLNKVTQPVDSSKIKIFIKNDGKRQAARNMFNYIMTLENPGTIRIFSDEVDDWLLEDNDFANELLNGIKLFTQKGFRVQRVQSPMRNIESTFRDIERWLPAYVAGTMKMFYYPWARDELHRRTIIVLPYHIALCSASLYGQRESQMTILTIDPEAVDSLNMYFENILERCQTMIDVYNLDNQDKIIERIQAISQTESNGVYKSHRLSAHTLPMEVVSSVSQRGSQYVQKVMECYGQTERFKAKVLNENIITDIMCMPRFEDVLEGKEPIPGTEVGNNTVYYTPIEYLQHLRHIIWYLNVYANYRVVLVEEHELENVVIYAKGDKHTLLIKRTLPFALFEITDRTLASAISEYLKKLADDKICSGSRADTLRRLKNEASRTEAKIKQLAAANSE